MRFLLIEDNQNLSSAVSERLSLDGHVVDQAESLGIANHYLSVSSYDLILLDIMLPDGDGRDFDYASKNFVDQIVDGEGREGILSFVEKREPNWKK